MATNKKKPEGTEQPEASEKPSRPAESAPSAADAGGPTLDSVVAAMKARKEEIGRKAKLARQPLSTEKRAKVQQQRLQLAEQRGGVRAFRRAVELNAAELGVTPEDYAKAIGLDLG